ncbi:hypothetical protein QJS04_geneDACA022186 [Acorus gramineus]|uniref:Uncharacterized protein n=1 Tax=Acorus gramineus TaxID=55184 RepID=A0AAV9BC75_ACOGR|nr:hypothetical protein QJS04_geneDACA022186 [Acorus gramineus]
MERVDLRSKRGQAKVVGTVACVAGAMIMTLLKGPQLNWLRFDEKQVQPSVFLPSEVLDDHVFRSSTSQYWMLGAAMLFLNVGSWSGFVLYQRSIHEGSLVKAWWMASPPTGEGEVAVTAAHCCLLSTFCGDAVYRCILSISPSIVDQVARELCHLHL